MIKIILLITFVTILLAGCNGKKQYSRADKAIIESPEYVNQEINGRHNAKNSLDYKGIYRGTLPTDDGLGMEVTLFIEDSTYTKSVSYIGKMSIAMVEEGKIIWNSEGTTITLDGIEAPNQYFVGENTLLQLNTEGEIITGESADQYKLTKDQ